MIYPRAPQTFYRLLLLAFAASSASAGSVNLSWNSNSEPDIASYRVHYGTAAAPYSTLVDVATTSATIKNLEKGLTYTFAISALNNAGVESGFSVPVSYTVGSPTLIPPAALANISSRALVGAGDDVMIGGFIIEGVIAKRVAVRAVAPSLAAYGLSGALNDPVLQLLDAKGAVVATNDNWNVPGQQVSEQGLAPEDSREAAVVASLMPGSYTAIVSGKAGDGGVALVDLYDLDAAAGRVANISTRSRVKAGENVMIGGFIIGGTSTARVLVRAIGPSLTPAGVVDALPDPVLDLYDGNGSLLSSNDNWRSDQEGEIMQTALTPGDEREAAIVATLAPGAYSGVIRGAAGGTGVALIEAFALNE
ncbi:hypothetical protein BH20VER3_BH20VER3_17810 [soil metagenome]